MSRANENGRSVRPDRVIGTTRYGARFRRQRSGKSGLILFIHGYLDDAEVWREVIERVDLPGWEMAAVDLHCGSDGRHAGATLEAYCEESLDVLAELQTETPRPVVIVGHSMGGQVAELVATRRPVNLTGMVLIVPAPLQGHPLPDDLMTAFRERATDKDRGAIETGKKSLSLEIDQHGLDLLVAATIATPPAVALAQLDAWTGGHPLGQQKSAVCVPTLLVTTDDTFFTHTYLVEAVAGRFVGIRLVTVPDTGHWPHVERPDAVADIISGFVRRIRSERAR